MTTEQVIIELAKIIVPPLAVILSSFITFKITKAHNETRENKALILSKVETFYDKLLTVHSDVLELSKYFRINEADKITRERCMAIHKSFQNLRVYEKLYTGNIGIETLEWKAESHLEFILHSIKTNNIDDVLNDGDGEETEDGGYNRFYPSSYEKSLESYTDLLCEIEDRIVQKIRPEIRKPKKMKSIYKRKKK